MSEKEVVVFSSGSVEPNVNGYHCIISVGGMVRESVSWEDGVNSTTSYTVFDSDLALAHFAPGDSMAEKPPRVTMRVWKYLSYFDSGPGGGVSKSENEFIEYRVPLPALQHLFGAELVSKHLKHAAVGS